MPRAKRPSCDRCGRRRQRPCRTATEAERALATAGLRSLVQHRLQVGLIAAPQPNYRGHQIRVAMTTNPAWYRAVVHRRPDGHSVRSYVERALAIVVAGCVRQHHRAMDEELLDTLDAYDDFGPGGRQLCP